MSKARPVIPGATLFSTRRVHKQQFLLRPSPRVNQVILYIVAVLAQRYQIQLHALCYLSNHGHDVETDPEGRIVEFQRDCHALIARHINAMFGEFEGLWSRQPTCRVECEMPDDILDKIAYTMTNPVEALLVEHGRSWPGVRRAWPAPPKKIRRPPGFFRSQENGGGWPEEVTLEMHRPPGFDHLSDDELAARLQSVIADREEKFRKAARAAGRRFLGRRAVLAQSRHAYPSSWGKRFGTRPTVAARSKWARIERLQRKKDWDNDYDGALRQLRAGNRDVPFPHGTYKLRTYYRLACGPPPA